MTFTYVGRGGDDFLIPLHPRRRRRNNKTTITVLQFIVLKNGIINNSARGTRNVWEATDCSLKISADDDDYA